MFATNYQDPGPSREQVNHWPQPLVLEFGTDWCGYCKGAQPLIETALTKTPAVEHVKVEDGPGRPLGRSFRVKLWPTLIFIRDGEEIGRVVRPGNAGEIEEALNRLAPAA